MILDLKVQLAKITEFNRYKFELNSIRLSIKLNDIKWKSFLKSYDQNKQINFEKLPFKFHTFHKIQIKKITRDVCGVFKKLLYISSCFFCHSIIIWKNNIVLVKIGLNFFFVRKILPPKTNHKRRTRLIECCVFLFIYLFLFCQVRRNETNEQNKKI